MTVTADKKKGQLTRMVTVLNIHGLEPQRKVPSLALRHRLQCRRYRSSYVRTGIVKFERPDERGKNDFKLCDGCSGP